MTVGIEKGQISMVIEWIYEFYSNVSVRMSKRVQALKLICLPVFLNFDILKLRLASSFNFSVRRDPSGI